MKNLYLIRLIPITIDNYVEDLFVENTQGSNLIFCKFTIREGDCLYNKFETFGFYVDLSGEERKFILYGNIDEENANTIWEQVKNKLNEITSVIPLNF